MLEEVEFQQGLEHGHMNDLTLGGIRESCCVIDGILYRVYILECRSYSPAERAMPATEEIVRISRDASDERIAIVTMHNPERRNAFSLAMREALLQTLEHLMHDDAACRAIVLTGAGGAFCAGGDLSEIKPRRVVDTRRNLEVPWKVFELIAGGPKPVVAAVEGPAMGAGLALAAACDIVVAARNARFCAAFLRVGLLPDTGLLWSLTQRVGGRARELMMTARDVHGEEALRMGLADQLVEAGATLEGACTYARCYAAMPPLALAALRTALAYGSSSFDEVVETEKNLQPLLRMSQDHAEAITAFKEKRASVFAGL